MRPASIEQNKKENADVDADVKQSSLNKDVVAPASSDITLRPPVSKMQLQPEVEASDEEATVTEPPTILQNIGNNNSNNELLGKTSSNHLN